MFSYNVNAEADKKMFEEACRKIESEFKDIKKEKILEDVDGTSIQIYNVPGGTIKVFNDFEVDAVYIDSEIELKCFE